MGSDATEAFRDSARDLLGRADQLARLRRLREEAPGFERTAWRELAEAGWLSILVPEDDGGLGLSLAEVAAIAEKAGRHLMPEPFVGAGVQSVAALCRAPESELRTTLLHDMTTGAAIAGLAWQEEAGQIDASRPATSAVVHGERITLDGTKRFVPILADILKTRKVRAPPMLGEHTAEILREVLSLDDAGIAELQRNKVI